MLKIGNKMMSSVTEKGMAELEAWNASSQELISVARLYIQIFMIQACCDAIGKCDDESNRRALIDLLELYLIYNINEHFSGVLLNVTSYLPLLFFVRLLHFLE